MITGKVYASIKVQNAASYDVKLLARAIYVIFIKKLNTRFVLLYTFFYLN